jgi:adenylylsulfate kinase
MFRESSLRSAIKAVSWRFWATVTTMVLVYLFTGTLKIALAIGGLEVVLKMIIYFFHERTWDKIRYGRKEITPFVLWLTGLPGSGKTTLADTISEKLSKDGYKVERLDGDSVRRIFPSTGFSKKERNRHIQRVGHLASMLEQNGIIVIASFISPYQETRDFVRGLCRNFVEIHMTTPPDVCEKRDRKGLYEKARRGEIVHFTGVDDPYENPVQAELTVDAGKEPPEASANKVLKYLQRRSLLS